jgi:hypothetical protein
VKPFARCLLHWAVLTALVVSAGAQTAERRANFTGRGGDNGKCTIEVEVDGVVDVEIRGDRGVLRTLSGQPGLWRRFECNALLPANPGNFRFTGIDGRGSQTLLQDPNSGRGVAVVRIQDPKSGAEGYTFDLEWRGLSLDAGPPQRQPARRGGRIDVGAAISACQGAVEERLRRDGYGNSRIASVKADNRPGRSDWIVGTLTAQQGQGGRTYNLDFACSVDFATGDIRSVDVNRQ